jgi:hypothetical protein
VRNSGADTTPRVNQHIAEGTGRGVRLTPAAIPCGAFLLLCGGRQIPKKRAKFTQSLTQSNIFEMQVALIQSLARRIKGLKIPRSSLSMWVRPPPPAPPIVAITYGKTQPSLGKAGIEYIRAFRLPPPSSHLQIRAPRRAANQRVRRAQEGPETLQVPHILLLVRLTRISRCQNTGQWEWEPAKLVAAKLETFGRWGGPKPEPPPIIHPPRGWV